MYRFSLSVALLMMGLVTAPVHADKKPDAPVPGPMFHVMANAPKQKMVKATFLGITADRVSPALNSQLKLPKGLGLVVTHVADDSPAQAAGLEKHDVLHKLDDQLLVNFEQLAVLIRLHEPGDTVKLTLIRGGESQQITATLAEHEVPELSMMPGPAPGMYFPNMTMPSNAKFFTIPKFELEKLKTDLEHVVPEQFIMPEKFVPSERFKLSMKDGNHTIELNQITDDGPHLKVTDADDKVLFDGVWDPESEQQPQLPEEVMKKIHQMISMPDFGEPIRIQADEFELIQPAPSPAPEPGV